MPFYVKKPGGSSGTWTSIKNFNVKKPGGTSGVWTQVKRGYIKKGLGWVMFWPKSGPYTTKAPYFSSDQNGLDENRIVEPIVYGTTFYGQRGTWDANGGTISSYTYKLDAVSSATIGEGTITNIITERSMGTSYIQLTANSSAYDGKWLIFTVKATDSSGAFGVDDTDNTITGQGYRIPVIKKKPTRALTATTLWINGSPGITTKPAPGDAVSLIASWDSTEDQSIDATRTITKWYRSSTPPTLITTPPLAATGGYYNTTGATLLGTGIAYVVTSADNNSYIFANQEVFNSFTDYNYGTAEGNGIKTGAAFTQTVGEPYSFAMGNTLYHSTNGSVAFDAGFSGTGLPSSGRHLFVYGLDLVNVSTKHWSNNKDYVIQYTGGQVFNHSVPQFQITYQVKFSTDHPTYALVRIINKGSNVPQPNYIGYYEGSTQISTVAGPYVLDTGSTYRINLNGSPGTTSGITFAAINNGAFVTDSIASQDNVFYTLVTGTFQYTLPTINFNNPTIGPTSLSYTVASTGNDFASYDYIVRTGSHSGTVLTSGSLQTGTLSITGLSNATTYYIQVDPYNSQNQNGTRMFFDATTTNPPGIPTNLTRSTGNAGSKTFSWSAPTTGGSVTSYEYQLNSTGWISNGSSTSIALTGLSGTNTFQVRALGPGGTGTSASTGSFVIPTINSGPSGGSITSSGATVSWTSTNQSSYSLSVPGATGTPFTGTTATSRSLSLSSATTYTPTLTITSSTGDTATLAGSSFTTPPPPPATPTITYSNVTFNSFTVSWSSSGATSYNVSVYESISGNSVFSASGTTATTVSPSGLNPNFSYSTTVTAINAGGNASNTVSQTTSLGPALTPTFGTNTSTTGGFFGSVTNYNASYTWGISASVGSVAWSAPSGSTRAFTVSGLSSGQSSTVTVTTSRTGYNNGSAQTVGSATLIQYTVTWDANGGTVSPTSNTVNAGLSVTAPTPTRSGYTFSTWRNPLSGGDPVFISAGGSYTPTANITFYAIWTIIPVIPTITMGANSGVTQTTGTINWTSTNQASFSATGTFNGSGTTATSISRTGLSPGTNYSGTVTVTSSTGHTASADYSLTTSVAQYTVTWNANGGTGGGSTTQNAGVAHTAPSPGTRSGFTFNGYYNTQSGDFLYGPIASGGSFTPPSTITMYARWTAIVPNVTQITATGLGNTSAPYIRFTITTTNAASVSIMLYRSATSSTGPWTPLSSPSVQSTSGTLVADFGSRTGTTSNWYYVDVTPYFGSGASGTAGTTRTSRVKRGSDTTTTTVYP
jgi:uncharacterized repeat protein (TIGR02543 family)